MPNQTRGLDELVSAIAELTPDQRRQLQRRLHTGGLFVTEELATDQNRLRIAPAVAKRGRGRSPQPVAAPAPQKRQAPAVSPERQSSAASQERQSSAAAPERQPGAAPIETKAAASPGKVVLGAPQREAADPQTMAPLPGQAPDQPIMIVFDGGSRGNPGEGYGSYQMRWPGSQPQVVRLRFGDHMTNNEAEYDTLIGALDAVLKRLRESNIDPATARVDVRGDSLLVIKQVLGEWKCKDERMEQRRDRVRSRLRSFGEWRLTHHDRENSVRALGH